ncbi:TPA: hypothetical protein ACRYWJ_005398, partial [Klebsiella pneumoniae]
RAVRDGCRYSKVKVEANGIVARSASPAALSELTYPEVKGRNLDLVVGFWLLELFGAQTKEPDIFQGSGRYQLPEHVARVVHFATFPGVNPVNSLVPRRLVRAESACAGSNFHPLRLLADPIEKSVTR